MILQVSPNLGILFLEYYWTEIIPLESPIGALSVLTGAMTGGISADGAITPSMAKNSRIENSISDSGSMASRISLNSRIL